MLTSNDIFFHLSGGANNSAPSRSLGGTMSSISIHNGVMQNLFPNVTPAQAASGLVDYICMYVFNDNPNDTMFDVEVWVSQAPDSPDTAISIGADPAGAGGTATTTPNRTTAPSGVTFSNPSMPGINLGDLLPEEGVALWVKRIVSAGAFVLQEDNFELAVTAQES